MWGCDGIESFSECWIENQGELDYDMWISVGSTLMAKSLLIWQLAFPKGLGVVAGRPKVAPSIPIIFDVQLLYIPNVSDFDEQKADDPKNLPIDRGISSPLK